MSRRHEAALRRAASRSDELPRRAVSLALKRQFLVRQETQGIGIPWGNWISTELRDALRGERPAGA